MKNMSDFHPRPGIRPSAIRSRFAAAVVVLPVVCAACAMNDRSVREDAELLAGYFANPDEVAEVEIVLTDKWFTDVIPPGGGFRALSLRASPEDWGWVSIADLLEGEDPPTNRGWLRGSEARSALHQLCARLHESGCARALEGVEEERGLRYFGAHRYSFLLSVEGRRGRVEVHRSFPLSLGETYPSLYRLFDDLVSRPDLRVAP